ADAPQTANNYRTLDRRQFMQSEHGGHTQSCLREFRVTRIDYTISRNTRASHDAGDCHQDDILSNLPGDITNAGRSDAPVRSVKGNRVNTTSPRESVGAAGIRRALRPLSSKCPHLLPARSQMHRPVPPAA